MQGGISYSGIALKIEAAQSDIEENWLPARTATHAVRPRLRHDIPTMQFSNHLIVLNGNQCTVETKRTPQYPKQSQRCTRSSQKSSKTLLFIAYVHNNLIFSAFLHQTIMHRNQTQ